MARTEVTGKQIKDQSVDLTVDITGVLPVANGGSGSDTLPLNNVILGNGSGAVQAVAPGTAGNVLTSNGTSWVSSVPTGGTGGGSSGPVYYSANVGDGTSTSITVTHNLNTRDVSVSIWDASTYEQVNCDIYRSTVNTVTLVFKTAPAANAYRVAVLPGGGVGPTGATGATGGAGAAATVSVGSVTTVSPGATASVANSGTSAAAVLDFSIPAGATGATGATGPTGPAGAGNVTSVAGATGAVTQDQITGLSTTGAVVRTGSNTLAAVAPGTSGNVLTSNGTGWVSSAASGAVSSVNGATGAVSVDQATGLSTTGVVARTGSNSLSTVSPGTSGNVLTSNGTAWVSQAAAGVTRSVSTVTASTTLGATAGTDYVCVGNISNGDTNYSSVTALLKGEGTNGSTTITDSSPLASPWTASGTAKISTGQYKYESGSIFIDGTAGSYITASAAASNFAFGTGDFTIEFWVYLLSNAANPSLIDFRATSGAVSPCLYFPGAGQLTYYSNGANLFNASQTIAVGTWTHIALCRSGTTTRLFFNGTSVGSATDTLNYVASAGSVRFGNNFVVNASMYGYMDDIRVTKGVARYTTTFSAPGSLATSAGTPSTITLPTAVSNTNLYTVINGHASDALTVSTTSSQTINGAVQVSMPIGSRLTVTSDGSGWRSVATDVTSTSSTPVASTLAGWDANRNISANNHLAGFTTTATAAGTTALTVASTPIQVFTGTSTQTVTLPTTSVPAGAQYQIINNSTGLVTVQSSGANTILILGASTSATFTAVVATPTTAANWSYRYIGASVASGKKLTVSNTLTLAGTDGTTMTFPGATDTVVSLTATQTLTNKTLTSPTITGYTESVVANGTVTTSKTIDLTNGTVQTATLTANTTCTFTMPTATAGKSFTLFLKQPSATGGGSATFTGVKWTTLGAPTISTGAGIMDILTFMADGANWYGQYSQGYVY